MKKYLIVGLGNPGSQYENTPHNVGFMITESLAADTPWTEQQKGLWEETLLGEKKNAILVRPLTFMNASGKAIAAASKKHGVKPDNVLVIHDELDIAMGSVKMTFGKSAGTHKGVASIIASLRTKKFWRLRVGIAPPKKSTKTMKDFLLTRFPGSQKKKVFADTKKIEEGVYLWLENHDKGMQCINTNN